MDVNEYKALVKSKNTTAGKGKTKQPHISSSDVSNTSDDFADKLLFKSATEIAKNQNNGTMVSDMVYISKEEAGKIRAGLNSTDKGIEKEGITIVMGDGQVVRYLKI